jgi:hypothetical protein
LCVSSSQVGRWFAVGQRALFELGLAQAGADGDNAAALLHV